MENKILDPVLGELIWDKMLEQWCGKVRLSTGQTAKIYISADETQNSNFILQASKIFEKIRAEEYEIRQFAVQNLQESLIDAWNTEEMVSEYEFCRRIQPNSIHIYLDKRAEIYYNDDDLVGGHEIVVGIDEYGRLDDAFITG